MNPKVNICVPAYNRKDFLGETIDGKFAQTYKDYEIILADGSKDDPVNMLIKSYHLWQELQLLERIGRKC
jgi:glycosyltransferase involved in cell wall biosynthesis